MRQNLSEFFTRLDDIECRTALPMKTLTSFHIGGPADVLFPVSQDQLLRIIQTARELKISPFIMGNGTNLLVSDEGVEEPVICLNQYNNSIRYEGNLLFAGAGVLLSSAARDSVKKGFSGLEWANGIPGTIGGAVAMNAGAYGGEIIDVLASVSYIENGKLLTAVPNVDDFGYRFSAYRAPARIVVSACFKFNADDGGAKQRMKEYAVRRTAKQPLSYPSAGSVFKRPEGNFAGALIERAGLKGYSIGGAQVSELHAGFIINKGGACCKDVAELIRTIQRRVFESSGVRLECEIKYAGGKAGDEPCIY